MPLYDYRCRECGNQIEVIHAIDGAGPTECDVCGGAMRKALSPPAIHFRGTGWAKKDARMTTKPGASPGDKDAKKTAGGDDDGGSSTTNEGASRKTEGPKTGSASSKSSAGAAGD